MDKSTNTFDLTKLFESLDPNKDSELVVVDMDDLGISNGGYRRQEKPPAPVATFRDDPVALSCAAYRRWLEVPSDRWASFEYLTVTDDDRRKALELRSYYNGRYTMQALTGQLTEYQTKCAQFLAGTHHLREDELGLLYRLPYFYAEDLAIDQVVELTIDEPNRKYVHSQLVEAPNGVQVTPLLKVLKSRKSGDWNQYWFRTEHGHAVVQEVRANDVLTKLVDSLFKQPKLQINAFIKAEYFPGTNKQRVYGKLSRLELL